MCCESLRQSDVCNPSPHTLYFHYCLKQQTQICLNACSSLTSPKVINPLSDNASTVLVLSLPFMCPSPVTPLKASICQLALCPYAVINRVGLTWPLSQRKLSSLLMQCVEQVPHQFFYHLVCLIHQFGWFDMRFQGKPRRQTLYLKTKASQNTQCLPSLEMALADNLSLSLSLYSSPDANPNV